MRALWLGSGNGEEVRKMKSQKIRIPITATRVVYRVVVPHASYGMDNNHPTHLRVGKTTNAHTPLFSPSGPSHMRACGRSR